MIGQSTIKILHKKQIDPERLSPTVCIQLFLFSEYLPVVLGKDNLNGLGVSVPGTTYDKNVDPSMANEFAAAAYRFGHSMIQGNNIFSAAIF